MTVTAAVQKAGPFTCNGVVDDFDFEFKVFASTDVRVVRTTAAGVESDLTLNSDYTVSVNADQDADPGGTVTTTSVYADGKITLVSDVEEAQPTVLTNLGGYFPKVIERTLDRLMIVIKQHSEQIDRSVKVNVSSSTDPDVLLDELIAASAAAEASETAAAASAAAAAASETAAAVSKDAAAAAVGQISDGGFSWCYNGDFSRGIDLASTGVAGWYAQSPASVSVTRVTTAGKVKYGAGCAVTTLTAANYARQRITQLPGFGPYADWAGRTVTVGAWVYATVANTAYLSIVEGTGKVTSSSFHTGGGTLQWLTATRTITTGGSLGEIEIRLQNASAVPGTEAVYSGVTVVRGAAVLDYIPSGYRPAKYNIGFRNRPADVAYSASTTYYMNESGMHTNDSLQRTPVPSMLLCRRIYVSSSSAPGAGESFAFNLRSNVTDTPLAATIADTNTVASLSVDTYLPAGNFYNVKLVTSAAPTAGCRLAGVIEAEELPH